MLSLGLGKLRQLALAFIFRLLRCKFAGSNSSASDFGEQTNLGGFELHEPPLVDEFSFGTTDDIEMPSLPSNTFDAGTMDNTELLSHGLNAIPIQEFEVPWRGCYSTLLYDIPWYRFRMMFNMHPQLSQAVPVSSLSPIPTQSHQTVKISLLNMFLSNPIQHESDGLKSLATLVSRILPEKFEGEAKEKLQQLLDISNNSPMDMLADLPLLLISNNAMPVEGIDRFVDLIMQHKPRHILDRLFSIQSPTVRAVSTKLLESIAKKGDKSSFNFLLDAGIDRNNLSGARGGRLLQLAVTDEAMWLRFYCSMTQRSIQN